MKLEGVRIGFALTGSFCTFEKAIAQMETLLGEGADVLPIMSEKSASIDTRFGKAEDFKRRISDITGKAPMLTIVEAENVGPKNLVDVMVVAPCTGNTLARLANGLTDGVVTMACKSHLRNQKPVIIAISTNDGLGLNLKNIGTLMSAKNVFMVPYGQDNAAAKPNSLVAKLELLVPTITEAMKNKQLQPVIITY